MKNLKSVRTCGVAKKPSYNSGAEAIAEAVVGRLPPEIASLLPLQTVPPSGSPEQEHDIAQVASIVVDWYLDLPPTPSAGTHIADHLQTFLRKEHVQSSIVDHFLLAWKQRNHQSGGPRDHTGTGSWHQVINPDAARLAAIVPVVLPPVQRFVHHFQCLEALVFSSNNFLPITERSPLKSDGTVDWILLSGISGLLGRWIRPLLHKSPLSLLQAI